MPVLATFSPDSALTSGELSVETWQPTFAMCDEREPRRDSEPAIFPSLLFTEEEVRSVNWDAVFAD